MWFCPSSVLTKDPLMSWMKTVFRKKDQRGLRGLNSQGFFSAGENAVEALSRFAQARGPSSSARGCYRRCHFGAGQMHKLTVVNLSQPECWTLAKRVPVSSPQAESATYSAGRGEN